MSKSLYGAAAPVNGGSARHGSGRPARYRVSVGGVSVLLERSHAEMLALCRLLFAAGRPARAQGVSI